jgi:hypothetical protein
VLLERRTVSRKTPRDGRLELTKPAAQRLEQLGGTLDLSVGDEGGTAIVSSFECTCRGPDKRHLHYFLESDLLKALPPESVVLVELDEESRRIVVRSDVAGE